MASPTAFSFGSEPVCRRSSTSSESLLRTAVMSGVVRLGETGGFSFGSSLAIGMTIDTPIPGMVMTSRDIT